MKNLYLLLAILGAVVPYIFFTQYIGAHGVDLIAFVRALFVNPAASGFTVDLVISSVVFWIAILYRHNEGKGPAPWLFIILNLTIGLSCALPAYLYADARAREKLASATA